MITAKDILDLVEKDKEDKDVRSKGVIKAYSVDDNDGDDVPDDNDDEPDNDKDEKSCQKQKK
jgi:hypothetical protein